LEAANLRSGVPDAEKLRSALPVRVSQILKKLRKVFPLFAASVYSARDEFDE
jgi:hypothetical protein